MLGVWRRLGTVFRSPAPERGGAVPAGPASREHNLFDAAAAYVVAGIDGDQDGIDAAARRVPDDALMFGVTELAERAVLTLAREHGADPRDVARSLLGRPAA